jgi:hypothetical protein
MIQNMRGVDHGVSKGSSAPENLVVRHELFSTWSWHFNAALMHLKEKVRTVLQRTGQESEGFAKWNSSKPYESSVLSDYLNLEAFGLLSRNHTFLLVCVTLLFLIFFFVLLGIKLRAPHILDKYSVPELYRLALKVSLHSSDCEWITLMELFTNTEITHFKLML